MKNTRLKLLFDLVWQEVAASGGDGDGIVVFTDPVGETPNITRIADDFEEWMKEHEFFSKYPFYRHNVSDKHIFFSDNSNENISFYAKSVAPDPTKFPWHPEIYLEVWDWSY